MSAEVGIAATGYSTPLKELYKAGYQFQRSDEIQNLDQEDSQSTKLKIALDQAPRISSTFITQQNRARMDRDAITTQSQARLNAEVTLFEGFKAAHQWQLEKSQERVIHHQRRAEVLSLQEQIKTAYFSWIRAHRDLHHLKETENLLQKRLSDLGSRVRVGRARPTELMATQAQILQIQGQQIDSSQAITRTIELINQLTGPSSAESLPTDLSAWFVTREIPHLPALDKFSINRTPSIASLEQAQVSIQTQKNLLSSENWPTLNVSAAYIPYQRSRPTEVRSEKRNRWEAQLRLEYSFTNQLAIRQEQNSLLRTSIRNQIELTKATRHFESLLKDIHASARSYQSRLSHSEKALQVLERSYREIQKDVQFGQATSLEVLQAISNLTEARQRHDALLISYWDSVEHLAIYLTGQENENF